MKKLLILLVVIASASALLILSGCTSDEEKNETRVVNGLYGEEIIVPKDVKRIVSTMASNTELLLEFGMGDKIVGVDKYSPTDGLRPDAVTDLNFYPSPPIEEIIALEPDVLFTSDLNKVGSEDEPFKMLKDIGVAIVHIPSCENIADIYKNIEFIGKVLNLETKATEVVSNMKNEVSKIENLATTISEENRKDVYMEISAFNGVLYTFNKDNSFLGDILNVVGANNIFANESGGWISVSAEAVIERNPDVILYNHLSFSGSDIKDDIMSRAGFDKIKAVSNEQVFEIDKDASSRATHNIIKAMKEIAIAIYPDVYGEI